MGFRVYGRVDCVGSRDVPADTSVCPSPDPATVTSELPLGKFPGRVELTDGMS